MFIFKFISLTTRIDLKLRVRFAKCFMLNIVMCITGAMND